MARSHETPKIAAPAETLRRLAGAATREAVNEKEAGRPNNAKSLLNAAGAAYEAAAGRSASLVSIEAKYASTLAAFGTGEYRDGLSTMLRHQGYW